MKKFLFYIFIFFIGCSTKTTPIYAVIKTDDLRISDQGFLEEGFGYKKIVIYKAGVEPFEIVIKNSTICFDNQCFDKEVFYKKYDLSKDFFDTILDNRCPKGFFCKKDKNKILVKGKNILILIKRIKNKKEKI